jgi:hypothetical protein
MDAMTTEAAFLSNHFTSKSGDAISLQQTSRLKTPGVSFF